MHSKNTKKGKFIRDHQKEPELSWCSAILLIIKGQCGVDLLIFGGGRGEKEGWGQRLVP